MDNNENKMIENDISREDIIRSLRACCAGDCKNCAYWRGEENTVDVCDTCENEECGDCNKMNECFDSCYDELMLDAARELGDPSKLLDKSDNYDSYKEFMKAHPLAPVKEKNMSKDLVYGEYKPAPSDQMANRMIYICNSIKYKMEHSEFIEQKFIDELVAIVRYYNQFCCPERNNSICF